MNEILFVILKAVVIIVCGLITAYLIPWLKAKLQDTNLQELMKWVGKAVSAAEQTILGEKSGAERKAWVVDLLNKLLIKKNLSISPEQLDALVEAAVFELNSTKPFHNN